MKIFQMNDCDWIAAQSLEEALEFYTSCDGEPEDPFELSEQQMLKLKHRGADGEEYDKPISFKEELQKNIDQGTEFPCFFATTEI